MTQAQWLLKTWLVTLAEIAAVMTVHPALMLPV